MAKQAQWFAKLTKGMERDPRYLAEKAKLTFAAELESILEEKGILRVELARRLGSSPAYVTRILRADFNLTIATMMKIAAALGAAVSLHLRPARVAFVPKARRTRPVTGSARANARNSLLRTARSRRG